MYRPLFWEVLVLAIGLAETYRVSVAWATPTGTGFNALKDEYEPGFLGFDPLGLLKDKTPEEIMVLETKELNNVSEDPQTLNPKMENLITCKHAQPSLLPCLAWHEQPKLPTQFCRSPS